MEPFGRLTAVAVPLGETNLDTDRIVPARFLERNRAQGFGDALFHDMRRSGADGSSPFPIDDPRYAGARILVTGANFGCGSSREQAVHALADAGFRAVVAPSFGDIFQGNCLRNGLLAAALAGPLVVSLIERLRGSGNPMTIDLADQSLRLSDGAAYRFDINPVSKRRLLLGMDELGQTLGMLDRITAYETARMRDPSC